MRKSIFFLHIVIFVLAIAAVGCRPKGDVYYDPNDPLNMIYTTYTGQFEAVWRGMNTHYAFWSVDTTDWNEVYSRMKPQFEELDRAYSESGVTPDSATLVGLYAEATSSLVDHHMVLHVRDVHTGVKCVYSPGKEEVLRRDYTLGQTYTVAAMKEAITGYVKSGLLDGGQFGKFGAAENYFGTRDVDGRKIAYLWLSSYRLSEVMRLVPENEEEERYRQRKIKRQRNIAYVIAAVSLFVAVRKM